MREPPPQAGVGRVGPMALTMAGFFCMGIPISAQHWCFSVFVLPVEREFGWSRSEVNLAYSVGMVASGIAAPLWGWALDRYGARQTLASGELLVAAGWLARSQAASLGFFYASFALAFSGLPACVLAVPRALGQAFPTRRGTVVGVATTGASFCSMILVPTSEHVIDKHGWKTACFMFAACHVVVALLAAMTFRSGVVSKDRSRDNGAAATTAPASVTGGGAVVCTITFGLFAAACNFGQLCYAAVAGSLVPYYADNHFSEKDAALLAGPLLAVPNLIGKLGFGRLSDSRLGALRTFQIVFVVLSLSLMLFNLAALTSEDASAGSTGGEKIPQQQQPSLVLVAAATVLFGSGYGGFIAMQHTATMNAFGMERFGTAMGAIQGLVIVPGIGVSAAATMLYNTIHDT